MKIKTKILNSNFWISLLLILAVVKSPLFVLLNFAEEAIQRYYYYVYVIVILLIIISSIISRRKLINSSLLTSIGVTVLVIIGCFLSGAKSFVEESFAPLFVFMLLPFNLIQLINAPYSLKRVLHISIFLSFIIGAGVVILYNQSGFGYGANGMLASYAISIPAACYVYMSIVENNKYEKLFFLSAAFVGILLSFFGGSRGALSPILFGILLGLVQRGIKMSFLISVLLVIIIIYANRMTFLSYLVDSRSLSAFTDGSLSNTSGRDSDTWIPVINAIMSSPLWGWGCFSDRLFTVGEQYAHNLFLEVACDFGLLVGLYFTIYTLFSIYKRCVVEKNRLITILFLMSIPQLLLSSSYLLSINFWLFFGFILFFKKRKKFMFYDNLNYSFHPRHKKNITRKKIKVVDDSTGISDNL